MWGHGRQYLGRAIFVIAIALLCRETRAQTGAARPPHAASIEQLRDLAPAPIPDAAPPPTVPPVVDPAVAPAVEDTAVAPYRNDAAINDLTFVDGQHGWAVGDAGVIWHTADAGRHWQQQASGVVCRLQSAQFIDGKNGWAAGGWTAPYTHLTSATLLRTHDGGEHWMTVDKLLVPALRRIQFSSAGRGCAIGQASALYPCGVFFTDDGGRQWSPLPTADAADCIAGSMIDVGHGAVAFSDGRMAVVRDGRIQPATSPPLGLASVRQMQFSGPAVGWLVGDGGLVMTTADGGQTWRNPPTEIAPEVRRQFDFSAVAVRGSQVWIAGSPGNRVFHSPDGGRSWSAGETDGRVPIHSLTFIDDLHGWCAGAFGTIEATEDGGRTWHRQRAGAERVAMMGIFSEPQEVPLELLARTSAADGYLSVVELINRRDVETHPPAFASLRDRTQEALAALGVQRTDFAWQFPLRQQGIDLPASATTTIWDQAVNGDGLAALDAHLVRQIRIWRPNVIVASDASPQLLQRAIVQAVRHAADPAFDKTMPPWTVQRMFASLPPGQRATITINSSQLAPRLGQSLAEMTWEPRGLMFDRYSAAPETLGFHELDNSLMADAGLGDFFSGLGLRPGSEARRETAQPSLEAIATLRRAALQRRNAQAILKRTAENAATSDWLTQINDLTAAMDARSAGEILFQLGQSFARAGQGDSARQVFELLVAQYPQHPLTAPAHVWLLQSYASSVAEHEAPVRASDSTLAPRDVAPAAVAANGVSSFTGGYRKTFGVEQTTAGQAEIGPAIQAKPAVRQAGGFGVAGSSPASRSQRAIQLAGRIERTCPALFVEPSVRLPLAAAYRRLGMMPEAEHALVGLRSGPHDAWWSCAEAESWLTQGHGPAPKSVWHCSFATTRPRLDGTLDDPIWQHAETVDLHSALQDDADWPATAKMACDSQFLYLAVQCRQAAGADYTPDKTPRPRQADLSAHDHVDLLLSPDRDYTSYYRLSIDHRGWVSSGYWNDAPWQPVCYVAAGARDGNWIVEAAIPWDQMVDHVPAGHREPWAVNIQRTVPGIGFQSWSNPSDVVIRPEGMGLLMFDPIAAARPQSANPSSDIKLPR